MNKRRRTLITIGYSFIVTACVSRVLIYAAICERGYTAIGSEYFAIPLVFYLSWKMIDGLFEILEEIYEEKKRRSRRARRKKANRQRV